MKGLRELHTVLASRDTIGMAEPSAIDTTAAATDSSIANIGGGGSVRSARSASTAPPLASANVVEDVYATLEPSLDDMSPSGMPNEKNAMRGFVAFTGRAVPVEQLLRHRRRWVALQDVPETFLQGWLEIQLPLAKRKSKYFAALVGDVLYYWLKQKKPDVNVGRILIDRLAKVDVEETGKKKSELRIVGWKGEEYRVHGKLALLEQWCLALKQAQGASTLDLDAMYGGARTRAHSTLTSGDDVLVFPVILRGVAAGEPSSTRDDEHQQRHSQVLLCVSLEGVRLCAPFLEGMSLIVHVVMFRLFSEYALMHNRRYSV